ncbi:hypothetical protein ACFQD0_17045 [Sulfitobacter aestuariivivens]
MQAHRDIKAALGAAKLSITDIFRFPVLNALAAHIDSRQGRVAVRPARQERGTAIAPTRSVRSIDPETADLIERRRAMRTARMQAHA